MIRALYTAASGMNAEQENIDNIANNLANVNTTGFKKTRVEFEDLVYQQTQLPGTPTTPSDQAPVGLEIGLGTRPVATARDFSAGSLTQTSNPLDVAIQGQGFLQVELPDGTTGYTRAGDLQMSGTGELVTNEGYPIIPSITIPSNATSIAISADGIVSVALPGQSAAQQVGTLQLANFQNPAGLQATGGNLFTATTASGDPITDVPGNNGLGTLQQGFLEDSNVSVVEEMVNMIMGQRAYEANTRVVKAADEMLQQVNNLAP
ncbi:MAG TPA: flagellar basal-body rod protein FlgG [Vicinamibacterales bacterium]|nr:flagellar basal-body rod protein FlgG [Vicinamibacterales bacterium]